MDNRYSTCIRKNSTLILMVITLTFCQFLYAQDPTFSQFQNIPIYFNPSFVGTKEKTRVSSIYRNQWPNSLPYQTFVFSYDQLIQKLKGGVGILVTLDNGPKSLLHGPAATSTINAGLIYSPKIVIAKKIMVAPSVQLSYGQKKIEVSDLNFIIVGDPSIPPSDSQANFFDISSGILINTKNLFLGFSLHHINTPDVSFTQDRSNLDRKQVYLVGGRFSLKKDILTFSPYIMFQQQFLSPLLSMNGVINYKNLTFGLGYQNNNSIPISLGFKFFNKLKIIYGFDYQFDRVSVDLDNGGIHELSIQYLFNWKKGNKTEFKE